jgi:hypothetical protein
VPRIRDRYGALFANRKGLAAVSTLLRNLTSVNRRPPSQDGQCSALFREWRRTDLSRCERTTDQGYLLMSGAEIEAASGLRTGV